MSKILRDESYWVSYSGVTLKYTSRWYTPLKKLWLKAAMVLMDHMELITTYNAELGSTGDIKKRVWSKKNGVELYKSTE